MGNALAPADFDSDCDGWRDEDFDFEEYVERHRLRKTLGGKFPDPLEV